MLHNASKLESLTDMQTLPTDYSHQQLVDALQAQYAHLIHDDFDEDVDMTESQHLDYLKTMSHAELVAETCTDDDNFTLSDFMSTYG